MFLIINLSSDNLWELFLATSSWALYVYAMFVKILLRANFFQKSIFLLKTIVKSFDLTKWESIEFNLISNSYLLISYLINE